MVKKQQKRELIPFKLTPTEMKILIRNKMRISGLSYDEACTIVRDEYRQVFRSEITRVNRIRLQAKQTEENFKQNFMELKAQ